MTDGAAFLAPAGDAQALALGIHHAAYHPKIRQEMIQAGLKRAQSLNWSRVARQLEAVYHEAITCKERRHAGR
jgi:glycosyltransferase involved in cell wall biosynthesis